MQGGRHLRHTGTHGVAINKPEHEPECEPFNKPFGVAVTGAVAIAEHESINEPKRVAKRLAHAVADPAVRGGPPPRGRGQQLRRVPGGPRAPGRKL